MNKTYEEILDSMKSAYYEECSDIVEENSETMKRFEILASELFSLSCYNDFILKQSFIQTASGEYLDKLGEVRGCERKTATVANGRLCFRIAEPSEEEVIIPSGTVCSVKNKPYMQYATDEQARIPIGETEISVRASSLSSGAEYNAKAQTITVMVNAPVGVNSVTNEYAFTGGYTTEDDDTYRERILKHYTYEQNGINAVWYENRVLQLDYVYDCKIVPSYADNSMIIYVSTKSGTLDGDEMYEIVSKIPFVSATGIGCNVVLAQKDEFDLMVNIGIKRGYDHQSVVEKINDTVTNALSGMKIGHLLIMNNLRSLINQIDGVDSCEFFSHKLFDGIICPDEGKVLSLNNLEVNIIYG